MTIFNGIDSVIFSFFSISNTEPLSFGIYPSILVIFSSAVSSIYDQQLFHRAYTVRMAIGVFYILCNFYSYIVIFW